MSNIILTWNLLKECGAFIPGHFVGTSGKHLNSYIEKVIATNDWATRSKLATALIRHFFTQLVNVQVIVGTPMGALSLATEISTKLRLPYAFLEKDNGGNLVLRGANLAAVKGRRLWQVEDIITSGGSTVKGLECLSEHGHVIGVSAIVNREGFRPPPIVRFPDLKFFSLAIGGPPNFEIKSYPADGCPLCKAGEPINVEHGHGAAFLKQLKSENPALWKKLSGKE